MTIENNAPSHIGRVLIRIGVVVFAVAMVVCVLACTRTDNKPACPTEKVTIAFPLTHILVEVAETRGYFKEEGLEATLLLRSHGKAALQELLDGKADFAGVSETPFIFAAMKGEKISIIASIQTSTKTTAIIARKDKGILATDDLKGRKIVTTRGTTGDFFMDAFLSAHGIPRKDVNVVDMKPELMTDALANGQVDAASAFGFSLIEAQKKLGDRGITFYDEELYTQSFVIVAKQEYIRKNPEAVRKMLRSLIKAEDLVINHPDEAQKIIADFGKMDIAAVREIWADTTFHVTLDQSLLLSMEDESLWAIKNGLTTVAKVPNYLDFIYLDGLKSIKPEAVRILR